MSSKSSVSISYKHHDDSMSIFCKGDVFTTHDAPAARAPTPFLHRYPVPKSTPIAQLIDGGTWWYRITSERSVPFLAYPMLNWTLLKELAVHFHFHVFDSAIVKETSHLAQLTGFIVNQLRLAKIECDKIDAADADWTQTVQQLSASLCTNLSSNAFRDCFQTAQDHLKTVLLQLSEGRYHFAQSQFAEMKLKNGERHRCESQLYHGGLVPFKFKSTSASGAVLDTQLTWNLGEPILDFLVRVRR
jgi:hypothetical protein